MMLISSYKQALTPTVAPTSQTANQIIVGLKLSISAHLRQSNNLYPTKMW